MLPLTLWLPRVHQHPKIVLKAHIINTVQDLSEQNYLLQKNRAAQRKIYQTNFRRVPWIRVSTHAFFVGFWIREFLGTKRTWNNSREVTKHAQFKCNPKHVIIEFSNSFRIQTFFIQKSYLTHHCDDIFLGFSLQHHSHMISNSIFYMVWKLQLFEN